MGLAATLRSARNTLSFCSLRSVQRRLCSFRAPFCLALALQCEAEHDEVLLLRMQGVLAMALKSLPSLRACEERFSSQLHEMRSRVRMLASTGCLSSRDAVLTGP